MSLPVEARDPGGAWATRSPEEKRAHVLAVADELFSREGIDISVPDVARAAGVGVGSLYRQVGNKDALVAALLVRRADGMRERFAAAAAADVGDLGAALREAVLSTVDDGVHDRVLQEAWNARSDDEAVRAAHARVLDALRLLVRRAVAAGVLRADATETDLRLAFRGTAAAEALHSGGARRLAELVLTGLAAP
jgi:AcrR family transcriptional regulator